MIAYTQINPPLVSRRTMTFLLVACLHAAVLYGLIVHVISQVKVVDELPLVPRFLDPVRRDVLPPTPGPRMTDIRFEPDAGDVTGVTTHEPTPREPPRAEPHVVSRVQGGPGPAFRVPMIPIRLRPFSTGSRALRRSGHGWTGRGASWPSRRLSNPLEADGLMKVPSGSRRPAPDITRPPLRMGSQ